MFLICDAPGHGVDINDAKRDSYPDGSPEGLRVQSLMKIFAVRRINFNVIRVNNRIDIMIGVMKANYDSDALKLSVSDLESAVATKSNEEVTKEFVAAASFILSASVGLKPTGKATRAHQKGEPLWETNQFEVG